ncbi:hypothetical protein OROMI_005554 [Orobanche minor]
MEIDKDTTCISENAQEDKTCEMEGANSRSVERQAEVPIVGMKFNSIEEAYNFYKQYARRIGFGVCKRSSTKGADSEVKFVIFACVRQGKSVSRSINPLQPRPTAKTECKARIRICGRVSGNFTLTRAKLDHNHDLSPTKSRFHKCNRALTTAAKRRIEVDERAGIRMSKTFSAISVESGGYDKIPFLEKDCRNFKDKTRRLRLLEGDADAMHKYFLKMQADNSEFFYVMDLDEKGSLKNVFCTDARSRAAFKEFGDVVTFDTTYLTNKYDMPFAPFVGVNHHGLSILLGCALISKEDTDTFVWLFRA